VGVESEEGELMKNSDYKEVKQGNTKKYDYENKSYTETFSEHDVGLCDGMDNVIIWETLPREQFYPIIQSLINRYEYRANYKKHMTGKR